MSVVEAMERRLMLAANVVVNTGLVRQTITGMGGNAARVVWAKPGDEAADDRIGRYAVDQLKPKIVRVAIPWKQWEPVNDNADPESVSAAGFKDAGRVHNEFLYMQELTQKGITLIASASEAPEWMWTDAQNPLGGPSHTIPDEMFEEAAESLTQYLKRAKDVYGVNLGYLSFNEANFGIQIFMPADRMARFIALTGQHFAAAGLSTRWLTADTFSTKSLVEYAKPILDYAPARPYLGPISYHSWWSESEPDSIFMAIAELAKQYNKEVWSPEVGYDALAGRNQAQFATWNNAMRLAKIYSRVIKQSRATVALYWEYQVVGGGDVNDFPLVDANLNPYPAWHIIKQLSDNLPPGVKVVEVNSDDPAIMTLAARDVAKDNTFVQAINTANAANTVTFSGLPFAQYTVVRSSPNENGKTIQTVIPNNGVVTLALPAQSVTALTTLGQPTPPAGQTPFGAVPTLPATVQVENFDNGGEGVAFHDLSAANEGGAYRGAGVDVQAVAGGFAVSHAKAGEWIEYTIDNPQAGNYDLSIRYASLRGGGRFHLEIDGKAVTPSLTAQSSGAWQTYRNVAVNGVAINAGRHVLRLVMDANDSIGYVANFDSIGFARSAAAARSPFKGAPFKAGDLIQAEDFDNGGAGIAFNDTTPANEGGAYRGTAVDIQGSGDTGGGFNVGWTKAGEWLTYSLDVTAAGNYVIDARVAALAGGAAIRAEFNSLDKTGTMAVRATGGWQSYTTLTSKAFGLSVGSHVLRVFVEKGSTNGFAPNMNWFRIRKV